MSLMTHQDFQVYAIIINHSCNAKMDEFDILVSLILSQTHLCLFNFHRNVSVSHWFVCSKRPAPLSVDFQDRLIKDYSSCTLVGCRKQRVKQKSSKRKKSIRLTIFSSKNIDIHVTSFYHSRNFFIFYREVSYQE